MENPRTPINPSEEAALELIEQCVDSSSEQSGISREDAVSHLVDDGIEQADANARIKQLLLKGYLYEVDNELRIPPRR
ncbi:hypothetical protein [Haloarcula nitratireducens]|uniref:Uncharacterized protein n=1 Tax=Haloarcula nitratireducens TaxID=2487749 RepID=A0AAW4PHE0_9EURY|nr:hypothetical protein [Halomicroarcula nitratireducens]MBX0297399.1 hypothetical protein [Halomicroarcula nitratireducens]